MHSHQFGEQEQAASRGKGGSDWATRIIIKIFALSQCRLKEEENKN